MRLLVVRHGATDNNIVARYTGQSDIPLSALGERQVEALGQALAAEHLDVIVTSDLVRARATAHAIARHHQELPILDDPDLREIAMGDWEGHTHAEIMAAAPEQLERWQRDPAVYAPPGGETLTEFSDRIVRAFARTRERYSECTVVWSTHGGLVGVLLCHVLGLDIQRRWQFRRDNAAITELDVAPDGVIVMRHNETAHLRGIMVGEATERRQIL